MSSYELANLPSPFYRVALKVVIRNGDSKVLFLKNADGNWELPGGGWEHDESLEACIGRELREEIGVGLRDIGRILFTYKGISTRGWHVVRIVLEASTVSEQFRPSDGMAEARFVGAEEFLRLPMDEADEPIKASVGVLWPK